MKKIIIFLSVMVVLAGSVIYLGTTRKNASKQEQVSINEQEMEEDTKQAVQEVVEEQLEQIVAKEETSKPEKSVIEPKESKTTSKQEVKQSKPDITEASENEKKTEEKLQPVIPQEKPREQAHIVQPEVVDHEYERLKKQVEYATYQECLDAGFKIAIQDTVNILGFTPQEIAYKGEILGYKLHIDYVNPMEN